ncbi:isocitrate/isopropylmalate family dehydrogenase [Belnapia sp. F-4-1]|uniref:isocitrate/isopropylmalate family dehydrogenase n=1 Tax=Belnapia sp. F-4-1 TaxID=1545443 RepID=UPI000691F36F|nr:isocitrate/isopropylmalate family dehydrogenase [Belnapia sp. F-4-1]
MAANSVRIAVLPGDGIGTEVTDATLAVLEPLARRHGIGFSTETLPAGAFHYQATGEAFPESSFRAAEGADAILLGAMGWPGIRQADGTEIAPQLDLRFRLGLYAGVRPVRAIPGVPVALANPRAQSMDFVLVRESTEGLFHSRGAGLVTEDRAEETLRITRATTEKLSRFSFRLAERRAARLGRKGRVTLVNIFPNIFPIGISQKISSGRGISYLFHTKRLPKTGLTHY